MTRTLNAVAIAISLGGCAVVLTRPGVSLAVTSTLAILFALGALRTKPPRYAPAYRALATVLLIVGIVGVAIAAVLTQPR